MLGPFLETHSVVSKPETPCDDHNSVVEHARYLRFQTKLALEAAQYTVDFGEAMSILEFWQRSYRASDPGSAEILHADKACGAIVIFPSSVGSMCELGLFAAQHGIAQKTLAVVHKKYEADSSFFRQALLKVFKAENGDVIFKDYANEAECAQAAVDFVDAKYNSFQRSFMSYEEFPKRYGKVG